MIFFSLMVNAWSLAWGNYKEVLHNTLDLQFAHPWADWESKGTVLSAKVFKHDYIIKSRVVEIWNEKSSIYNNIIYPKTGSNLPVSYTHLTLPTSAIV